MYRISAMLLVSMVMLLGCAQNDAHAGHDHAEMDRNAKMMATTEEQLIYYTCPMVEHKHIHSGEPGTCSECGMTLVAGVTTTEEKGEYYGCPMLIHSHVRQDSSGTCDECGMKLKPMRLKES